MLQIAKGKVSADPVVLAPPLVTVNSCDVTKTNRAVYTVSPEASSRILTKNAFRLAGEFGSITLSVCFVFEVSPPTHLASVEFEGACESVMKVEGGAPSPEIKMQGSGLFHVRYALPDKVERITMTIPRYYTDRDDKKTYVRFIFGPPTPVIASVGLALRAHEASMDCRLATADGGAVRFHRAVLAARSAYFDKLFYGEFIEARTDTVAVEGTALAWGCVKSMMYAQTLGTKDGKVLIDTLETIYRYDLEAFVPPVWEALSRALDGFVAVRALRVAGLHENAAIGVDAMCFIQSNVTTLMCDCEWVRQYANALEEIGGVPKEFVIVR